MSLYHSIKDRTWMDISIPTLYVRWRLGPSKGNHNGLGSFHGLLAFSGHSMMLFGNIPSHFIEIWLYGLTM